jgi:serine/threonine-protein kinase RsbW/stage II sporulation protein AB (anti-sigma F factor)
LLVSAPARPESVGELRREIVTYARSLGASEAACDAVALATSEALTNAVVHAYVDQDPGRLFVEAWHDPDGYVLVLVCDEGRGMLPRTDSRGLGLGLSLIAQMADDVRVTDRPDTPGTIVSLRFSLDGSGVGLRD